MRWRSCRIDTLLPRVHVTRASWPAVLRNDDGLAARVTEAGRSYVTLPTAGKGYLLILMNL